MVHNTYSVPKSTGLWFKLLLLPIFCPYMKTTPKNGEARNEKRPIQQLSGRALYLTPYI